MTQPTTLDDLTSIVDGFASSIYSKISKACKVRKMTSGHLENLQVPILISIMIKSQEYPTKETFHVDALTPRVSKSRSKKTFFC